MTNKTSKYYRLAGKTALLILYFFLLAPQCNSRFYSIANFYLFTTKQNQSAVHFSKTKLVTETTKKVNLRHLSLDKRFRNPYSFANDVLNNPGNPLSFDVFGTETKKQFCAFTEASINAFQRSNSLRGPPVA
jgi:hypothetical protein